MVCTWMTYKNSHLLGISHAKKLSHMKKTRICWESSMQMSSLKESTDYRKREKTRLRRTLDKNVITISVIAQRWEIQLRLSWVDGPAACTRLLT